MNGAYNSFIIFFFSVIFFTGKCCSFGSYSVSDNLQSVYRGKKKLNYRIEVRWPHRIPFILRVSFFENCSNCSSVSVVYTLLKNRLCLLWPKPYPLRGKIRPSKIAWLCSNTIPSFQQSWRGSTLYPLNICSRFHLTTPTKNVGRVSPVKRLWKVKRENLKRWYQGSE